MKTVSIIAALFLCLLVGCRTGKHSTITRNGSAQGFESRDDFQIELQVYRYLLQRDLWSSGEYTAVFLAGNDAEVAALLRKLPAHVPPLKPGNRALLHPKETPMDKDTGKPAMVLSAKAMDPTNGVSEAIGTWYAGESASGLYAFVLMKLNGQWTIQSVR